MHSATTTKEMSPSELSKCRENLKRQWENRQVDEALLRRAWETVRRVAIVLYQDYGATKVAVFGSLAERERFTKGSDIDIAVWGLSYDKYHDAHRGIMDLRPDFKIDLINFEESTELFRERLLRQAILVKNSDQRIHKQPPYEYLHAPTIPDQNGAIYEMNRSNLIQRVADEHVKIEQVVDSITELLQEIEVAVPRHKKFFEELTAKKLVEIYDGIERIFERIAREVDMHTPKGSQWHNALLKQMSARRAERPHVISQETFLKLQDLLDFRHKVRNIYGNELIYQKTLEHAKPIKELFATVSEELNMFTAFLKN